ncbi:hypothetical protein [Streptomyces sp. NPDC016172]|uniref:hypothetical protein n=1 Tax=Streptomyces sp. NPDC016172 TaxID=3364964 RepID=UPI0036FE4ED1
MKSGVDLQRAAMAEICSTRDDWSFHVNRVLRPVNRVGNMMVAVVVKPDGDTTRGSGL